MKAIMHNLERKPFFLNLDYFIQPKTSKICIFFQIARNLCIIHKFNYFFMSFKIKLNILIKNSDQSYLYLNSQVDPPKKIKHD